MKFHPPIRRGIALVIVLVLLVLMLGLILAFFSGVTTQRGFSRTAADAASTQQLADSAVNIVMSQIVDATGTTAGTNSNGTTLAWASQPGMIRTYDDTGAAKNFYKLYSSDSMIVPGSGFTITTDDPNNIANGGWNSASNVGLYTDLNAPVLVADPAGSITTPVTNGSATTNGTYTAVYPIIDPFAENTLTTGTSNGVDGFSISSRPGYTGGNVPASSLSGTSDPSATTPGSGSTANPAPMPAKWLYLLSQGQIIAPDPIASSNGVLKFTGSNALVSATNPIVGRIAFWADDDTSKVNINTASEGTYFDVPRIFSAEDCGTWVGNSIGSATNVPGMANAQPVQREYQRYPGHPATTCLSPVLGNFGMLVTSTSGATAWSPWTYTFGTIPTGNSGPAQFNPYYAIAPRIVPGGSASGTILCSSTTTNGSTLAVSGTTSLVPDNDRLYASVDELMFTGTATSTSGTSARIINPVTVGTFTDPPAGAPITKSILEKTRFFLTANSNAPETTLFNTPRVSMWPEWDSGQVMGSGTISIPSGTSVRTPYDQLAAFCGTIGGSGYYFTRAESRDDKYDYTNITRNQTLYSYLRTLTNRSIPGFGGASFQQKYLAGTSGITDCDQILTLMFDYIRCTNLADSEPGATPYTPLATPNYTSAEDSTGGLDPGDAGTDDPNLFKLGTGEVVPIKISTTNTMGAGRILTISEADLLFYAMTTGTTGAAKNETASFRVALLLQFASPMQGMQVMRSSLKYSIQGVDKFTIKTSATNGALSNFGFPSNATNYIELSDIQTCSGCGIGGVEGPAEGLLNLVGHTWAPSSTGAGSMNPLTLTSVYGASMKTCTSGTDTLGGPGHYPFFTPNNIVVSPSTTQNFTLSGGPVTITLMTQDKSVTVQTINLTFPSGTFKVPNPAPDAPVPSGYTGTIKTAGFWRDLNNRLTVPRIISGFNCLSGTAAYPNPDADSGVTPPPFLFNCPIVTSSDAVIGVQIAGIKGETSGGTDATAGDVRMIAPLQTVPPTGGTARFGSHKLYGQTGIQFAHGLMNSSGDPFFSGSTLSIAVPFGPRPSTLTTTAPLSGELVPVSGSSSLHEYLSGSGKFGGYVVHNPYVPMCVGTAVQRADGGPGDWDTGIGNTLDGAYMNKPDDGDVRLFTHNDETNLRYPYQLASSSAYYTPTNEWAPGAFYFSPNREVPSAMMFGSIPTGVQRFLPWQTLLFNPKPEDSQHPGHGSPASSNPYVPSGPPYTIPPDHLIADLFWMPVVEPYAISLPLSTAGKINMNYQILPFTYIKRQTGLFAVMKATKFAALPLTDGTLYKPVADPQAYRETEYGYPQNPNRRYSINIPATLLACDEKFANSDIYRSATQICDLNLIPNSIPNEPTLAAYTPPAVTQGSTAVSQAAASYMANFWSNNQLTGANLRDKPYVDIYPRLTTKSNTFTVHIWVQSLRQVRANASAVEFVDPNATGSGNRDSIVSEYRGSTTIERYIDPNDPRLSGTDFATNPSQSIDPYYKFRVVGVKRFSP